MTAFERALRLELESEGLNDFRSQSLVIFEKFREILEKLFEWLALPACNLLLTAADSRATVTREDVPTPLQLRVPQSQQHLLLNERTQIGVVDGRPVYFDRMTRSKLRIDDLKFVLGDPVQTSARVFVEYQRCFSQIEAWGQFQEAITHPETRAISIFFKSGEVRVIEQSDPWYQEYAAIFSHQEILIGEILADPLMYLPDLGFYNGRTGCKVTDQQLSNSQINQTAFAALSTHLGKFTQPQTPQAAWSLKDALASGDPIQVGMCAGRAELFFSVRSGTLIRVQKTTETQVFVELRKYVQNTELLALIPPATQLHVLHHPKRIISIQPDKKPKVIAEKDRHFQLLYNLHEGKVGTVKLNTPTGVELFTISYRPEVGIFFDKQPDGVLPESSLLTPHGVFSLHALHLQHGDVSLSAEQNQKPPTTKQKRQKERKNLPTGRRR